MFVLFDPDQNPHPDLDRLTKLNQDPKQRSDLKKNVQYDSSIKLKL
jgi:hypothetical protein